MSISKSGPLKRGKPIKRSRMKPSTTKRLWDEAIAKRDAEGACRVCGHAGSVEYPLEAAHTVGRARQDVKVSGKVKRVPADAVICLCRRCHQAFDQRRITLLGSLTMPELRNAVAACKRSGLDVRRRLGGGRDA